MNLSGLLKITNINELYNTYIKLYEKMDKDKFVEIYNYLKSYNIEESDEFTIHISFNKDESYEYEESYYDVYGTKKDDEQHYSLEFSLWKDWISYKIDESTSYKFTREEIYSHIFWEMTYHGYEESDIQDVKEELERRVERIHNGEEKFFTFDEIKEKFSQDHDLKDCE